MQKGKLSLAVLGALVAMPAVAEEEKSPFSANISLVSDYLYRGISQTGHKPAIQGGFDFVHSSGFYAGIWGTNISWLSDLYTDSKATAGANNASVELDTYVGFKKSFADDFTYDVGFLRYNYPGSYAAGATKADTNEVYGAVGYKWIAAKYSYSLGDTFANANTRGTDYFELNANYPFEQAGIILGAHYGKQTFRGAGAVIAAGNLTYSDYKLNVTKEFAAYEFALAYSKTNATAAYTVLGQDLGKGTVVLSVSRLF
jgi:uncharacterized protein (TIGR02001 family)